MRTLQPQSAPPRRVVEFSRAMIPSEYLKKELTNQLEQIKPLITRLEGDVTNTEDWGTLRALAAGGSGLAWALNNELEANESRTSIAGHED